MSVVKGGIYSKPRGKTAGLVWGAARTRTGKLATVRELVPPSNPNTAAQQTQRGKFKSILTLIRTFGAVIYQTDWNRSVGQLPGFQSMESIYLSQIDSAKDIALTLPINLGILHFPDTFTAIAGTSGILLFNNSTELGANGTALDDVIVLAAATLDSNRLLPGGISAVAVGDRQDEDTAMSNLIPGAEYQLYVYMKGAGTASGIYSIANVFSASAGA